MYPLQKYCLSIVLTIAALSAFAQAPNYPQGYFRNPLDLPMLLAGNFGECRPGHFHSGMDIKTGGVENKPVYAAADGYISRVKMEPGGFGHGIYITHPNGYTTLYAHLNDFMPALQALVRSRQYAAKNWEADIILTPDQFPVKQGDQIAFSGNTGGSTAPHLHFEIRDTQTEHPLNPQLFGFDIKDTLAPVPLKIAIYDRSKSIYMDAPIIQSLKTTGSNVYRPVTDTIPVSNLAGIGIEVNDFMNGSDNTLAFYTAEWYLDGRLQGRIRLNDIGYDKTRYLHAYADYKTRQSGPWIQCLFKLPGNELGSIYEQLNGYDGALQITDNKVHKLEIRLADVAGNNTTIKSRIRYQQANKQSFCKDYVSAAKGCQVATLDLRYTLDNETLYDDACADGYDFPSLPAGVSERKYVLKPTVPAHHSFPLSIKTNKGIPFALRNKVVLVYNEGKKPSGKAAKSEDKGWYGANVRAFGEYYLATDTTPPTIIPSTPIKGSLSNTRRISFVVQDNMTSIRDFNGTLDGQWILFEQHENNWFYEMDAHCPKGTHKLIVQATDENGNSRTQSYTFTR